MENWKTEDFVPVCSKQSFIHSITMCRMRQFLAVRRSFFHSFLLCTFSCHPSPPTILPSSLTSFYHLFLGLLLNLYYSQILFSSTLCTCPNQHNLFNLIVSIIVGFLTLAYISLLVNLLAPNDDYSGRTAPLTSKCCILYIYSTNIGTEYFKHGIHSPFFPLQNTVGFIILTYLVPVLFTFYIQGVIKFKKIILAPKG